MAKDTPDNQNNTPSRKDFIRSDVKPPRYEKPEERPAPSPPPP